MSDDVKHSWHALGEQMSALGSLVRQRISAPADDHAPTDDGAERATEQIKAALDQVIAATKELGERIGDATRDDDVKATAKETMSSLDDALRSTVNFIADEVEGVVKPSKKSDDA